MLELKNITKTYKTAGSETLVLKDVNLSLPENQFVSILGASGSGKTTLLNIIGGLDKYSSGDLIIDGTSTKNFKDKDWDSYRNATIGFVFQSYNLISHLSVLENITMALSLAGISSKEGKKRAIETLEKVGLKDHANKRPNQLSGGQMQRVAIARALVTNPRIVLADEPTGALDSKTSVQIMELLKEISKDRLVIMVTHNPELAQTYSDRMIKVKDGEIIDDTMPSKLAEETKQGFKPVKTSMSLLSAIKSSAKNLWTKKVRTILVTLAGSIGILSIGLVLALSNGMTNYIDYVQKDVLVGSAIRINENTPILQTGPRNLKTQPEASKEIEAEKNEDLHKNIIDQDVLGNGKSFLQELKEKLPSGIETIYQTGYRMKVLTKNFEGDIKEVAEENNFSLNISSSNIRKNSFAVELPENKKFVLNQYEVLATKNSKFEYPTDSKTAILVVGFDNTLPSETLKALGYKPDSKMKAEDFIGKTFSVLTNDQYYKKITDTYYQTSELNEELYNAGKIIEITAVIRPKEEVNSLLEGALAYPSSLGKEIISSDEKSQIVQAQKANKEQDIFSPSSQKVDSEKITQNLQELGADDTPIDISIHVDDFKKREETTKVIDDYNKAIAKKFGEGSKDYEKYRIEYVDIAALVTQSMNMIILAITIILVAFAAISLVVSSIMIGILTYVSVIERTKEIGIMRAIGARKKDVTRIFKAESTVIGFMAGLIGVGMTYIITLIINPIVATQENLKGFVVGLLPTYGIILILLSMTLTYLAGWLPARGGAKKNPVEALRTE